MKTKKMTEAQRDRRRAYEDGAHELAQRASYESHAVYQTPAYHRERARLARVALRAVRKDGGR